MIDYTTINMIARTEHQLMTKSLAPVPEYGAGQTENQSEHLLQRIGGFIRVVGNGLVSVADKVAAERRTASGPV